MPCVDLQYMIASFHDQFTVDFKNAQAGLNTLETGIFEKCFLERDCISVWKELDWVGSPFWKAVTAGEKSSQTRQHVHFLIKLQMIIDDKQMFW